MPRPAQVSLTLDRAAAADLREVKAAMARDLPRVPTLSDVIRTLAALWREMHADSQVRTGGAQ